LDVIVSSPQTRASIGDDLSALGLRSGDIVLAHSSLRSLGWVCGGPVAVVQALLDVIGPAGTLVVPAQTMGNSDPKHWSRPPVPESWWPTIRATMPAFDPAITPTTGLGAIPELVRTWPGAVRSNHPHTSLAAVGAAAAELMADHPLDCQLGERSPLAKLERAGAKILFLGTGFDTCTAFHLAEYRHPNPTMFEYGAAVHIDGERHWVTYVDVDTDSDDFAALGAAYEQAGAISRGNVGEANCRLFPLPEAVAFATGWLATNRQSAPQGGSIPIGDSGEGGVAGG
jgi:aminoglycoside 3-N-acetyltransferase